MTKLQLFNALNQTAAELKLSYWSRIEDISFVPSAIITISSLCWLHQQPENENTKLIREQGMHLIRSGKLIFE